MNLQFDKMTINEIINAEESRPYLPKVLHDDVNLISSTLGISAKRIFAEALQAGLKTVIRRHKLELNKN